MTRSAGITSSYTAHAIMADGTAAFKHEVQSLNATGFFYVYANCDPPFAETFDLNIAQGTRLVTVKQLLPDIEVVGYNDPTTVAAAISQLSYSLFFRNSRSIGTAEQRSAPMQVRSNGYVDFRTTGRDIRLRLDLTNPSNIPPLTVGQHTIDVVPRGDR
jgi:hypothetical protein